MPTQHRGLAADTIPPSAFFIGIGGMGMRGLAMLWHEAGSLIFGTDDTPAVLAGPALAAFTTAPAATATDLLRQAAVVVYSDAVVSTHPLRVAAAERGIPELPYHEAVGIFSRGFRTIVVTGTHGKSSTTALLAHLLTAAGQDPTALVGAPVPGWGGVNARSGTSDLFVVEGDEYREHFLSLSWQAAVLVSVDFDHPDYFTSLAHVEAAYTRFLQLNPAGWLAVRAEVQAAHPTLAWPQDTVSVADDSTALAVSGLPGEHMRRNATLALAAAAWAGVPREVALPALATFPGLGRRFEHLGTYQGLALISDYGHHPAEIAATLRAAREQFAGEKVLALWEPHTLERLQRFGDAFAAALAASDGVVLLPTYQPGGRGAAQPAADTAARRAVREQLTSAGIPVWEVATFPALGGCLAERAGSFTAAICFSAGRADAALRTLVAGDQPVRG